MDEAALLQLATSAAHAAGKHLFEQGQSLRTIRFQDARDVKLQADEEAEALIRRLLAPTGLPIIGEEEGGDASLTEGQQLYWVVDPLDGTFNYLRSSPHCAVSIGLLRGEEPILGVIYDFHAQETFAGGPAYGLLINDQPYTPSFATDMDQAALQTGFPHALGLDVESLQGVLRQIQQYKKIRMIGTAALALAYTACGRFDVYYEPKIRLWDIAAGLALVKAVGGVVSMVPSAEAPALSYDVWAAGNRNLLPAGLPLRA